MLNRSLLIAVLCMLFCLPALAQHFTHLYGETAYANLTGLSSSLNYSAGISRGSWDCYAFLKADSSDTTATPLVYQYQLNGVGVGGGVRYWFNKRSWNIGISASETLLGQDRGEIDYRVGGAGYGSWEKGPHVTDLYGEVYYVKSAEDVVGTLRCRSGYNMRKTKKERFWYYGVGQAWASASGDNGTENRVEIGLGIGYQLDGGHISINGEYRAGASFSGEIRENKYLNPMIMASVYY